jgi:hypothetical protein
MPAVAERRQLLQYSVASVALSALSFACAKSPPASCNTSALGAEDLKVRTTLGYVDRSPDPSKPCVKCIQYIAASAADQCGGCKVMKGPVHPKGYCNVFAPA